MKDDMNFSAERTATTIMPRSAFRCRASALGGNATIETALLVAAASAESLPTGGPLTGRLGTVQTLAFTLSRVCQ